MKDIKPEKEKKINKKSLTVALDVAQKKYVLYLQDSEERKGMPEIIVSPNKGNNANLQIKRR